MYLVPAKCTQCGGNIIIDDTKRTVICEFCKTIYVSEKIIDNSVDNNKVSRATYSTTQINNNTYETLIKNGFSYLESEDYDSAAKIYLKIIKEYPDVYDGYAGLILSLTKNLKLDDTSQRDRILELHKKMDYYRTIKKVYYDQLTEKVDCYCKRLDIVKRLDKAKSTQEILKMQIEKHNKELGSCLRLAIVDAVMLLSVWLWFLSLDPSFQDLIPLGCIYMFIAIPFFVLVPVYAFYRNKKIIAEVSPKYSDICNKVQILESELNP